MSRGILRLELKDTTVSLLSGNYLTCLSSLSHSLGARGYREDPLIAGAESPIVLLLRRSDRDFPDYGPASATTGS